ncbi:solute carrier family 25 member 44 [Artemisia annua]|uniref:Solute carrier family 25 member 44 n=1 Tax=Artemisia annua TaxID=35608 RepID=A0A2U1M0C6_ARTAN|nr:solute carrier family 25 member 44 [Artemisia annua]
MSLRVAEDDSRIEINLPTDINWDMLDKSKFFYLGAALFSGVSSMLYPVVVLKTRQQVLLKDTPCFKMALSILRHEGFKGFYRGFGTSLMGTIPARALYMGALEMTKSNLACATLKMGFSEVKATAIANAAAGLSAAMAAQLVWTPIDVVSQRLMVQGGKGVKTTMMYNGGMDAFRSIIRREGVRGLYKGFGISILTYAPSNAVWWASYSMAYRAIYGSVHSYSLNKEGHFGGGSMIAVQGLSATIASGLSALVTMPLDTIKTRTQVLEGDRSNRKISVGQTVRNLVREGGLSACYRGLGPRWASMSISATTMITTYESLKKMSTKNQDFYGFLN